jgi:four helix bundle protein
MFKFEYLNVWKQAFNLGEQVNGLINSFPSKEQFNLSSQLLRAVDSVGLNIAEGSTGQSNAEQRKFISYANRSLLEVVACLLKAKSRGMYKKKILINCIMIVKSYLKCSMLLKNRYHHKIL